MYTKEDEGVDNMEEEKKEKKESLSSKAAKKYAAKKVPDSKESTYTSFAAEYAAKGSPEKTEKTDEAPEEKIPEVYGQVEISKIAREELDNIITDSGIEVEIGSEEDSNSNTKITYAFKTMGDFKKLKEILRLPHYIDLEQVQVEYVEEVEEDMEKSLEEIHRKPSIEKEAVVKPGVEVLEETPGEEAIRLEIEKRIAGEELEEKAPYMKKVVVTVKKAEDMTVLDSIGEKIGRTAKDGKNLVTTYRLNNQADYELFLEEAKKIGADVEEKSKQTPKD